jgi:hypothetical protein
MMSAHRPATMSRLVAGSSLVLSMSAIVLLLRSDPGGVWFVVSLVPIPMVGAIIL